MLRMLLVVPLFLFCLMIALGVRTYITTVQNTDSITTTIENYLSAMGQGNYEEAYRLVLISEEGGAGNIEKIKYWKAYLGIIVHKLQIIQIMPQLPSFGRRIQLYLTIQYQNEEGGCQELQAFMKKVNGIWKIDEVIRIEPGLERYPLAIDSCYKGR